MNGKKSSVKKFSKMWVYLTRLSLCFRSFEKYCSVCYWKLPKIQSGRFGNLFFGHCVFYGGYELIFILIEQFCKIGINFDHSSNP